MENVKQNTLMLSEAQQILSRFLKLDLEKQIQLSLFMCVTGVGRLNFSGTQK